MGIRLTVVVTTFVIAGCALGAVPEGLRIDPDVTYGHKAGLALTFDVYRPASQNGAAVLFINSGGFRSPDFSRQCVAEDGDLWGTDATARRGGCLRRSHG
ncbi:MAG: hypothetical protein GY838_03605 [bacterium]|nr:hypothetical protein [bacterium]